MGIAKAQLGRLEEINEKRAVNFPGKGIAPCDRGFGPSRVHRAS